MIQRRMHQLNGPSYRATLGGRPEVPLPGVAGRVVAVTAHLPKPPFPTVLKMGVISKSQGTRATPPQPSPFRGGSQGLYVRTQMLCQGPFSEQRGPGGHTR